MTLATDHLVLPRTPGWVRYLNQRLPGETPHPDDKFFNSATVPGTEVAPSGTRAWTSGRGVLGLNVHSTTGGTFDVVARAFPMTPTAVPVTVETAYSVLGVTTSGHQAIQIGFSDGTADTSNILGFMTYISGSGIPTIYETEGTFTALGFGDFTTNYLPWWTRLAVRCIWTAANTVQFRASTDGVTWTSLSVPSHVRGSGITPTHFYVGAYNVGTVPLAVEWNYIRVTEADLS